MYTIEKEIELRNKAASHLKLIKSLDYLNSNDLLGDVDLDKDILSMPLDKLNKLLDGANILFDKILPKVKDFGEDNREYYIYEVTGLNGELLYIGKGIRDRYLSHIDGKSSNPHINRYYFANGEHGCIKSEIIQNVVGHKEALKVEKDLIRSRKPKFNVIR